jgi:isopenicillin N synthase-like dioxygenase
MTSLAARPDVLPMPPIIDIGPLRNEDPADRRTVARALRAACIETGFCYVANHGIDPALAARMLAEAERFFEQLPEVKERVHIRNSTVRRGYEGIGAQALNAATGGDIKESVLVGVDLGPDHPLVRAGTPHYGPNQWPDELPGWREAVLDYFAAMDGLARLLLDGLAVSLDLPRTYFEPCLKNPMSLVRLLHYPPHPSADPAREVGCGAHTDWGLITILAQDDTGGLEIQLPSGAWVPATPVPGTFVVNIGDMMARWTNDLYRSTPHRVLNRSRRDRYSAVFFCDPSYHTRVTCLPTCCSPTHPARYAPTTAGEHVIEMYRKTYGEQA